MARFVLKVIFLSNILIHREFVLNLMAIKKKSLVLTSSGLTNGLSIFFFHGLSLLELYDVPNIRPSALGLNIHEIRNKADKNKLTLIPAGAVSHIVVNKVNNVNINVHIILRIGNSLSLKWLYRAFFWWYQRLWFGIIQNNYSASWLLSANVRIFLYLKCMRSKTPTIL